MKHFLKYSCASIALMLATLSSVAQSGLCTSNTPFYKVDLSNNSGGTWTSTPPIVRAGSCCGSAWPDRCIEFEIILHPDAEQINFEISSGAVPGGAMYYQIGCGPLTKVGDPICVNGPGPHTLTFCKPGSNLNTYRITSIPGPTGGPDVTTSDGCNATFTTSGLTGVVWKDITSGNQQYNAYLSCTSCTTNVVTPQNGYPAFVDYQVCGMPSNALCAPPVEFCDTVRANFISPIQNAINPNPAIFCEGTAGINLTAQVNGGKAPYSYIWKNAANLTISTNSAYFASTTGNYSLEIRDALYPNCPSKFANTTVSMELRPVVDAGNDLTICASNPVVNLAGTVINSNVYQWIGNGTFGSSLSNLNNSYIPTAAEINAGKAVVKLIANGINVCAAVSDSIIITINPALTVIINAPLVVCYGQKANLTATVNGGTPAYSLLWNTGNTAASLNNMNPGAYSISIQDASNNTCTATATVNINENPQLFLSVPDTTTIFCQISTDVTASASGGDGTYYYSWSNGNDNPTSTLYSGAYSINVSDGKGCSVAKPTVVRTPTSNLAVSIPAINTLCFGTSTTISPLVIDGFAPYSYSWNTGENTLNKTAGAGSYCITVTDNAGCKAGACVTINEDPQLTANISGPALICNDATGTMTVNVDGGRSPYTYIWNSGESSSSITKTAGTYSVIVSDANTNNCNTSASFTLNQASPLAIAFNTTDVSCFGGSDGSASVNASGSVAPYAYSWTPGNTSSSSISSLSAGKYAVTVTSALFCSKTDSIVLTQPSLLTVSISSKTDVSCYGGNDGTASAVAVGGTAPYTYSWTPSGENAMNASALMAGTNTVTVSDAKGCSAVASVNIAQPTILNLQSQVTNVTCKNADDGTAKIIANGGTRPYNYLWTPSGGNDSSAINLAAGIYSVTLTDAHGCNSSLTVNISEPDSLKSTITGNNIACYGGSTGSAVVNATGGSAPYNYVWWDNVTGNIHTGLSIGNFSVITSDAHGCTFSNSIKLTQAPEIITSVSPNTYIRCDSTGQVWASASGGTGVLSYSWSNGYINDTAVVSNSGAYLVTVSDANNCVRQDTAYVIPLNSTLSASISGPAHLCYGDSAVLTRTIIPGVAPFTTVWEDGSTQATHVTKGGSSSATVTDNAGCVFTANIFVIKDSLLTVNSTSDSVCFGAQTSITAMANGGLPPYSYTWNSGGNSASVTKGKGKHTVTVSDASGCLASSLSIVTEGTSLTANITEGGITCFGFSDGWLESSVGGGFSPYSYTWSNGDTNTGIYQLALGNYTLEVQDKIGCSITKSAAVKGPSQALNLSFSKNNISCFNGNNGSISITASGGSAPYDYLWWNGSNSATLNSLSVGIYGVSITDSSGCVIDTVLSITQPSPLAVVITPTMLSCKNANDGEASALATGGTRPYTYAWSSLTQVDSAVSNLSARSYSVTVNDANNCSSSASTIITEPDSLISAVNTLDAICYGSADGSASISTSGGKTPYTYQWSTGSSSTSINTLAAGNYNVITTDANGCQHNKTFPIRQPDSLKVTLQSTAISCYQACDGKVMAHAAGGTIPYSYLWNGVNASDSTAQNICEGTYSVVVSDNKGCTASAAAISLQDPLPMNIDSINHSDEICYKDCKGKITIYSSGASQFAINNIAASNNTFLNLCSGSYVVKVMNNSGCVDSQSVFINRPDSIIISTGNDTTVCPKSNVTLTAASSGGSGNLNYFWNNISSGSSSKLIIANTSSQLLVFTEDEKGCRSKTDTIIVKVHDSLAIAASAGTQLCWGDSVAIAVDVLAGDGHYQYNWTSLPSGFSGSDSSLKVAPVNTTQYIVSVKDQCSINAASDTVTITVVPPAVTDFDVTSITLCVPGESIYKITQGAIDSTYAIEWLFGDGESSNEPNPNHIYSKAGSYSVTLNVTPPGGCKTTLEKKNMVDIYNRPKAAFHPDITEQTIHNPWFQFLDDSSEDTYGMKWNFGDSTTSLESNPYHRYENIKCYTVEQVVWNRNYCRDSIKMDVCVRDVYTFFAPNSFTPNGDGINDFFVPQWHMMNESTYHLMVFDRWGELIYETYDPYAYWNGRRNNNMQDVQIDVYVWKITHRDAWNIPHSYIGHVSVLH
ncbi:MAG: PKD domain-containing protein [Flavobacteriales bacterium]